MTIKWQPKAPLDVEARSLDWAGVLLGDEIVTSTWVVVCGGVTLSNIVTETSLITLDVSGGVNPYNIPCQYAYDAVLTNTITTLNGFTYTETITQPIVPSPIALPMPGGVTKRKLIEKAFQEIGLAGYEFDPQPDEYSVAMSRLDDLMAEWAGPGNNMDLGYNFPLEYGGGDIDDVAGIPNFAVNTVGLQLALRIMPAIGKTMTAETRVALAQGIVALRTATAIIPDARYRRTTALGSGNRNYGVFVPGYGRRP